MNFLLNDIGYKLVNRFLILLLFFNLFAIAQSGSESESDKQSYALHEKSVVRLQTEIDKILASSGLRNTKYSVAVYSIDERKYYYQKNIDYLLTPASNTKLFTTFAALYTLGDDYLINTSVYTDAKSIESVLRGNLYIFGRGDALLGVSDLEVLAHKLQLVSSSSLI